MQKGLLRDKMYLTTPFSELQYFRGSRQVRRLTRQQQLKPNRVDVVQLYPGTLGNRYAELRRRLQFKTLAVGGQKYKMLGLHTPATRYLPEATTSISAGQLTLCRQVEAPVAAERFQLPAFARNRILRSRASVSYRRSAGAGSNETDPLSFSRVGSLALRLQRSKLLEKRFYRQHTQLRLPRTVVKRAEIKRSGARLFARNTLKLPTTLAGKRKLLLPAVKSYTLKSRGAYASASRELTDLRPIRRAISDRPRVWTRGPGYHESTLVYDIRDKKRGAAVRSNLRFARLRSKKATAPSAAKSLLIAGSLVATVGTGSLHSNGRGTNHAAAAKLALLRERILRAARYNSRRCLGQRTPLVAGCTVGRSILHRAPESSASKKQKAL